MKRLCEALASRTLAVLTVTVALALGLLAAPLVAAQQAAKVYRIGRKTPDAERASSGRI